MTQAERFAKFHADNPGVYELFKLFSLQVIAAGYRKFSATSIIQRIRWQTAIETKAADRFKINDHCTPYYARLFLADHPQHAGFFETRSRTKP